MKVKETIDLVVRGDAASSDEVNALFAEVLEGIKAVVWPEGGKDFAIFPEREGDLRNAARKRQQRANE